MRAGMSCSWQIEIRPEDPGEGAEVRGLEVRPSRRGNRIGQRPKIQRRNDRDDPQRAKGNTGISPEGVPQQAFQFGYLPLDRLSLASGFSIACRCLCGDAVP